MFKTVKKKVYKQPSDKRNKNSFKILIIKLLNNFFHYQNHKFSLIKLFKTLFSLKIGYTFVLFKNLIWK